MMMKNRFPMQRVCWQLWLDDNAEVIRQIRTDLETMEKEGSKDFGTSNFLEDMIEKKEKVTWMIRAHLE